MRTKKIYLLGVLLVLLFTTNKMFGQKIVDPVDSVNRDLRVLFSKTKQPTPLTNYLYDMSAHVVDSQYYESIVNINSNTENWFMLYDEMNNMAYVNTNIFDADTVYKRSQIKYQRDTISVGIIYRNYYTLTSDALNTNNYFDFDTVNNILLDKLNRPSGQCGYGPYCLKTTFSISSLSDESEYSEIDFAIDPDFIFIDYFNSNSDYVYKINVDDGNGFKVIDKSILNFVHASYTTIGDKNITIEVFAGGKMIAKSSSVFTILNIGELVKPDYNVDYPGMHVSVFGSCHADESQRKIAIVLEGIDPFDVFGKNSGRSASEVYDNIIKVPKIDELRKYGYEFWVVNWKNSMQDIRTNASNVINMINDLKSNIKSDNQYIVIGESLGGVVARYALTKMENDNVDHHTRELITIDSPHGGANVPLSIQLFYRDIIYLLTPKIFGFKFRFISNNCKVGLDSKAAKQLLLYHVNTANDFCDGSIYKCYNPEKDRAEFVSSLKSIGDFPKFCKTVAVTDGSLSGKLQTRAYSNSDRIAGDKLFDFKGELFVKILKIFTVPIWGIKIEMNTNPNGNGKLYQFRAGFYTPKIKLYWFGVKLKKPAYSSMCDFEEYGRNIKPFCVNAGGVQSTDFMQPVNRTHSYSTNTDWAFLFKVKKSNNGNGLYTFESAIGNPYVVSLNANFSIYSDGFHFGFIPVQSSIDYEGFPNISLDKNLIGLINKPDIMNHTPFNVVIGANHGYAIASGDDSNYVRLNNLMHVSMSFINDNINSICSNFKLNECSDRIRIINTEIGEDKLWLDNFSVNQNSNVVFTGNNEININTFTNPFYSYSGYPLNLCTYDQALGFSKTDKYTISIANNIVYRTTLLTMKNVNGHNFEQNMEADLVCCSIGNKHLFDSNAELATCSIYPIPFQSTLFIESTWLECNSLVDIIITDLLGRVIYNSSQLIIEKGRIEIKNINLQNGIYFLSVMHSSDKETFKIIKNE